MMRQRLWTVGLGTLAVMLTTGFESLEAQDVGVTAEAPVLLTSCGQSPGPDFVKFFLGRLQLDYELVAQATAQDLIDRQKAGNPFKAIIIVTGASLKGMGAAGVSMEEELIRTAALIVQARSQGLTLIGAHVEGMDRRAQGAAEGDNSDEQSIDAVMPAMDVIVVRQDGNEDRRFSILSDNKGVPLILFEKNMDMEGAFGQLFKK
jgi:hypothetical protein